MGRRLPHLLRIAAGGAAALLLANLLADVAGLRWLGTGDREHLMAVQQFADGDRDVDAVFYGTSVSRNAAVPLVIEERLRDLLGREARVWNLGLPGSTPEVARFYARELFRRDRPRLFVLEASPFLWNAHRVDSQGGLTYWRWFADPLDVARRLPELDTARLSAAIRGLNHGAEALWNLPFYLARRPQLDAARLENPRGGNYDYEVLWHEDLPAPDERDLRRGRRRVRPLVLEEAWRRVLLAVGEECRRKGIRLVVLHYPKHPRLVREFAPGDHRRLVRWISENTRAAGGVFVDLDGDPAWALQDADFRDFVHYSPTGARRFSRRLAEEILAPMLRDD